MGDTQCITLMYKYDQIFMVDITHMVRTCNIQRGEIMFTTVLAVLFPTIALAPSLSLENTQVEKSQVTVEVNSPEEIKVGKILEVVKVSSQKYPEPQPTIVGFNDIRAGELIDISVEDKVPDNVAQVTYKWALNTIELSNQDVNFKTVRFKPWPDGKSVVFSTPVDGKFLVTLSTAYTFVEEKDGKVGYCTTTSLVQQAFTVGKPIIPDKPVVPKPVDPNPDKPVDPKPVEPDKPKEPELSKVEKEIYDLVVSANKNGLLTQRATERLLLAQEKFLPKLESYNGLRIDSSSIGQQSLKTILTEWKNTVNMVMVGFDENNPDGPKTDSIPDSEWLGWNKSNADKTPGSPFNKYLFSLVDSGKLNDVEEIKTFCKSYINALKAFLRK